MRTPDGPPPSLPAQCAAVIVGGGLSGLSLATHLAATGWKDRDVLIVEDGSRPVDSRAWAFWCARADVGGTAPSASFDRFLVRGNDTGHLVVLDDYRYHVVLGGDLSRTADAALRGAPRFRRVRGHVTEIRDDPRQASVVIDGQSVGAEWVFDSVGIPRANERPAVAAPGADRPMMTMAFTGRRVQSAVDTFDPGVPTLMDFRTQQGRELAFVYVLPTSTRVALVELTRFTTDAGHGAAEAEVALDVYLRDTLGIGAHRVLATERGTLPLLTGRRPAAGRRVVGIGTAAGMVKASTGYGYARIQRHSAVLAASLASHGHPFDVPTPRARHQILDRVLLQAIGCEPNRIIEAFERLFADNPGDRVLEFLDERTTISHELATILTLPPAPFLRAARALLTGVSSRTRPDQPQAVAGRAPRNLEPAPERAVS